MASKKPLPAPKSPSPAKKPEPTPKAPAIKTQTDFIDTRNPNKNYSQDMFEYVNLDTGEKIWKTRGVVPAQGSKFVAVKGSGIPAQRFANSSNMDQYNLMLAEMQRRAQLGQFSPIKEQGGYIGAQENLTPIYGQQDQIPSFPTTSSQGLGQTFGIDVRQPMMPITGQMAQQPIPIQMPIMQQGQQPPTFGKANQQAIQNYQNLLEQGLANYQAQTYPGQGQFGSTAIPAQTSPQRKPSTPGFPTPKPFG